MNLTDYFDGIDIDSVPKIAGVAFSITKELLEANEKHPGGRGDTGSRYGVKIPRKHEGR